MFQSKFKSKKNEPMSNKPLRSEKRSDKWTLLLVAVGESRDRKAFAELFDHFAPLLKSFAQASNMKVGSLAYRKISSRK